MVMLPEDERLKVEIAIEDAKVINKKRSYLGMSGIANECTRDMWYGFRLCATEELTPRKQRLLSRGHKEEPIIVADLEAAGIKCFHTGDDQLEVVDGHGHMKGHMDGEAENVPDAPETRHLLEFKTANEKNFAKFKKIKDLQKVNPVYYGQCVTYMYKRKLKRTLFIVVNKNTDERYYERIDANNMLAKELIARGVDVIASPVPPAKIGGPDWFKCKWCKNYNVCHYGAVPDITCRTCNYCDIEDEGKWSCSRHSGMDLAFEQQLLGCPKYDLMDCLRSNK